MLLSTNYLVDSLSDAVAADGVVTLREAIQAANTNAAVNEADAGDPAETDVIQFAAGLAGGKITLGGTALSVTDDLQILGLGANQLTIDAGGTSGVLNVSDPAPGDGFPVIVSVSGLKLTGANTAAVSNAAQLDLATVWIHGNAGSGVDNVAAGSLVISNSTLSANVTGGTGGGLRNYGTATVIQSTLTQNQAATGAGIYNGTGGTLVVGQSTIVLNRASGSAGGIYQEGTAATLTNTIVALNQPAANAPDVSGAFAAESSHNLIGILTAAATGLDDPSTQLGTVESPLDPIIGGFGLSGGAAMPTHQLLAGSPAVDAGDDALAVDGQGNPLATDQRGVARITGPAVDIGATEGAAAIALNMTGPTGIVKIGHTTQITWDPAAVPVGSEIRLYYDADSSYDRDEPEIVVQVDTSWAPWGSVDWAPVLVPAGSYTVGGTIVQAGSGTVLAQGRVGSQVTIDYSSACTVTTADDRELAGDGVYALRECILASNANSGSNWTDVIVFDAALDGQTIQLNTSHLEITDELVIRGGTAGGSPIDITVSGSDAYRIFRIQPSAGSVILDNLTLTHGYTTTGGAAIYNETTALELRNVTVSDSRALDSHGGGIYTTGPTKLIDSRVDGCRTEDPYPYTSLYGGGVYSTGNLDVIRSEITNNRNVAGYDTFGGGIYSSGPRLDVSDSLIGRNTAEYASNANVYGGGIYKSGGVLEISGTSVTDNMAYGEYRARGGGIYSQTATVQIADTRISGNRADKKYSSSDYANGGGVYHASGTLSITDSRLDGNWAETDGGAILGTGNITRSTIVENTALGKGGGWYGAGTLFDSTLGFNSAGSSGGGWYSTASSRAIQSTVSNNAAATSGGGIYSNSALTVRQSTFADNAAAVEGGGLYQAAAGTGALYNTLLVRNTSGAEGPDVRGSTFDSASRNNVIGIIDGAIGLAREGQNTRAGSLENPLDVKLSSVGYNGGDTPTHRLIDPDNPALNAGRNAEAVDPNGNPLANDQRGAGFPRILAGTVDAGATEGYQTGLVDFRLTLTDPAGPIGLRDVYELEWTWQVLPLHTTITFYADPDGVFNGNEIYALKDGNTDELLVQQLGAAPQRGLYPLFARDIGLGTFTLGIVITDPRTGQQCTDRADSALAIVGDGALIVDSLANTDANDGELTLREAILAAARAGVGIADAPSGGVYQYAGASSSDAKAIDIIRFHSSLAGQRIDLSASSLPPIESPLAIEGLDENGAPISITISGGGVQRIMEIASSAGRVWLDGLALTSGYTTTGGGAIRNDGSDVRLNEVAITNSQSRDSNGGGIYTTGPTRLTDSSVAACQATTTRDSSSLYGGGIYSTHRLALIRSQLADNLVSVYRFVTAGGGGVSSSGPLLMLDSSVTGNTARGTAYDYGYSALGAGIHQTGATLSVQRSDISDNTAYGKDAARGGGLYIENATVEITDSRITGNRVDDIHYWDTSDRYGQGGGIYAASGSLAITGSEFAGNWAKHQGGGVYGIAVMTRSTLMDNVADLDEGGGWYGSGTLVDSTLAYNSAGKSGGGWYSTAASTVIQSTFSNNEAGAEGGGLYSNAAMTIRQSTITENHAVGKGGGIRQSNNGTAVITNTVITDNATDEPLSEDVFGENFSPASTYNRIGIVDGAETLGLAEGTLAGRLDNPLDILLSSLGDYGGPTPTHRLIRAYTDHHGNAVVNPALNVLTGDQVIGLDGTPLAWDQRGDGFSRVLEDLAEVGSTEGTIELGADFGLQLSGPTGTVTIRDILELSWQWSMLPLRTQLSIYADPDGTVNGNEIYLLEDQSTDDYLIAEYGGLPVSGAASVYAMDIGLGTFTLAMAVTDLRTGQVCHSRLVAPTTVAEGWHFLVNSLVDEAPARDGMLTLREAIEAANRNEPVGDAVAGSATDVDIIRFDPALIAGGPATLTISTGQFPTIVDELAIQGLGTNSLTLDAHGASRIFATDASAGKFWMQDLRLTGGASSAGGGAIYNATAALSLRRVEIVDSQAIAGGGAIYNEAGQVRLDGVLISNSRAQNSNGGGVYTTGPTRLTDSAVVGCQATIAADTPIYGGGIYSTDRLELIRAHLAGNLVRRDYSFWGRTAGGGAISSTGLLIVIDSSITGNTAHTTESSNNGSADALGGGIYQVGGSIELHRTTVSHNTVIGRNNARGGAVYIENAVVGIADSRITGNRADDTSYDSTSGRYGEGGGIYVASGWLTITDSEVSGNWAEHRGGGLYGSGAVTMSVVSDNTADDQGGGIYAAGDLNVVNSTLYGNTAGVSGGGLYAYDASNTRNVSILQSTIYGNQALTGSGGGIENYESLEVRQSTIAANTAATEGGGIRDGAPGTTRLLNTLVAKNDAATNIGEDVRGTFSEASQYNFIGIITDSAGLGVSSTTIAGNLTHPADPLLAPLAYNGGPTPTCLLIADPDVIATGITPIDHGSNGLAVDLTGEPLATDQRGAGFARIVGESVDIGAVEGGVPVGFQLTAGPVGDVRVGQTVTIAWQLATPLGHSSISLYADPDAVINGNEFWIIQDRPADDLPGRYDWTIFGLEPGTYTLGAIAYDAVTEVTYTDRLDAPFTLAYRGTLYVVDSIEDAVVSNGWLTLREAIQAASLNIAQGDAAAGSAVAGDVIQFAPELAGQTIRLTGGQLNVSDDVAVLGLGSGLLSVDGGGASRAFNISGGDSRYVWLEGLRLQNGSVSGTGNNGGAILADGNLVLDDIVVASSRSNAENGGGVYAQQPLVVRNSQFTGNYAAKNGGAIYAAATLDIAASSVTTNTAQDDHGGGLRVLGALTMDSVTVSGNRANNDNGGGLDCDTDALIRNSLIAQNYGRNQGGGLWVGTGTVVIRDTVIRENSTGYNNASHGGGGIFSQSAALTLDGVTLYGNTAAARGGGVYQALGSITIQNSSVSNNRSLNGHPGGGLHVVAGSVAIRYSTLDSNVSAGNGGLLNGGDTVIVENSTLAANTATGSGGAISSSGNVTIIQSTLSGNHANADGGALDTGTANTWIVRQSTIYQNSAGGGGGGIDADGATVKVYNTIIAGNTAGGSGQDARGAFSSQSNHNFIGIVDGSTGLGDDPNSIGGTLGNPRPARLGPLQDNGGPTQTHRPLSTSEVINAGANSEAKDAAGQPLTTDQRGPGAARIVAGTVDMGAVEYEAEPDDNQPPTIGSLSVSEATVDVGDPLTITALDVQDDHAVVSVAFYRDADGDGVADPEELLGTDTDGGNGWSWTTTANWTPGRHDLLAVATDDGYPLTVLRSQPATASVFVLAVNLPEIPVGTHLVRANSTGLRVAIYVHGLDRVTGFNLNAQLGDGSGGSAEPVFQSVDFAGSIWDAHPWAASGGPVAGATQYIQASVVFTDTGADVQADGLLCTLVINTTGFAAGTEFPLKLALTSIGVDSHFLLSHGDTRAAAITNGSIELHETEVVGRRVFYDGSYWDWEASADSDGDGRFDPGENGTNDDASIAPDKVALLPGVHAAFANYTSYQRGLNGLMIDILGLPAGVTDDDFSFRVGNSDDLGTWIAAPDPADFAIRTGAGGGGSDRIVLKWSDGAIRGQWLQVTVHKENVGLQRDDVFYFGNAPGESGNSTTNAFVDGTDFAGPRDNPHDFLHRAGITDVYDYNRDSFVDGTDMAIARDYNTNFLTALKLITPPAAGGEKGFVGGGEGEGFVPGSPIPQSPVTWAGQTRAALAAPPARWLSVPAEDQAARLAGRDEWFTTLAGGEERAGVEEDLAALLAGARQGGWREVDLELLDELDDVWPAFLSSVPRPCHPCY